MVNCKCCGSSDTRPYLIGYEMDTIEQHSHQYFKCLSCSAIFLNHVPLSKDYDDSGYYQRKSVLFSFIIRRLMGFFYQRRYAYVKYSNKNASTRRLLDIGCGKGSFLNVARQGGWSVTGIEPTKRSAEYARKEHGIEVIETGLHESNIAVDSFDVVTMWHVIEHLPDPYSALNAVHRVLVEEGIFIIAVPNISSFQAYFGGGRWFHLDPPRHLVHVSPKLLSNILKEKGFIIEKIHYFSAEYNVLGWFQTLQNKILPWPNFTFNLLKRNSKALPESWGLILGCISSVVLLLTLPIIIAISLLESILKRGGTITIVARKKLVNS